MTLFTKIRASLPNAITCTSLFLGCVAVVFSFNYNDVVAGLAGYEWAFILIGLAAVCDFMDGAAARALKAYSELGKQLDSLSDLVSFGVAPAMLVYNMMSLHATGCGWLSYVAFMIPVFGELRLARFNIDTRQSTSFRGMPIPANAIFWIGAVAFTEQIAYIGEWPMAIMVLLVSVLMVADGFKMFSLKFKNFALAANWPRFLLLAGAVVLVTVLGVPGLSAVILLYILLSAIVGDLAGR